MWEARAAAGRIEELVAHAVAGTDAAAQIYRSADDRVVVIDVTGRGPGDVPAELMSRPPHVWMFDRVDR